MPGPHPAVALTRLLVRQSLTQLLTPSDHARPADDVRPGPLVLGVSGGADSLALAAAVLFEGPKQSFTPHAVIVDHGLQANSQDVARAAYAQCVDEIGYPSEQVRCVRVEVTRTSAGVEADARRARYAALSAVKRELGARRIVLGHTGNDQAEQVLLGLIRGSGTRSIAGMRMDAGGILRPFLASSTVSSGRAVMRSDTEEACAALGLTPWQDPHNQSEAFTRVRVRRVLAALEDEFGDTGLSRNLVKTAAHAGRDADFLDAQTDAALAAASGVQDASGWPSRWPVEALASLPAAIRIRALRRLLVLHGARDSELASHHLYEAEQLLVHWRGQGPIQVPGGVEIQRGGGEVAITPTSAQQ